MSERMVGELEDLKRALANWLRWSDVRHHGDCPLHRETLTRPRHCTCGLGPLFELLDRSLR